MMKEKTNWLLALVGLLLVATLWLRLANLGYSNFQGDEIKALCLPAEDQNLGQFLLGQRKGPVQFLVTCLVGVLDPGFSSELGVRLPFAIASVLSAPMFYLLARQFFDPATSLYAALFLATNGLFVALGRIVQYQSITILCTLIGIYSLSKATQDEKWKISGVYIGFIAASLGILAHFDGVYVLPPMVYLLVLWWRKYHLDSQFSVYRNHLLAGFGIFTTPLLLFYIPFAIKLNDYQLGYWENRLTTATNSNTWSLFRFYNPGPIIWVYLILVILGTIRLRKNKVSILLVLWALPPFIFMELIVSNAGTHFYTYLMPLFLLAALGIETIQIGLSSFLKDKARQIVQISCILGFGFFFLVSHIILVDHTPEYPWQPRSFLGMVFPGGDLAGTFGFPYNRSWPEIESWITQNYDPAILLATNEKGSLATFYFPASRQFLGVHDKYSSVLKIDNGILVLWIENPQSWLDKIMGLRHEKWKENTAPVQEFRNLNGKLNGTLYYLTQDEVKSLFP